jgi:hypothetical protein
MRQGYKIDAITIMQVAFCKTWAETIVTPRIDDKIVTSSVSKSTFTKDSSPTGGNTAAHLYSSSDVTVYSSISMHEIWLTNMCFGDMPQF